ncbi:MAG: GNAT family N-acetyltransferase [Methanobrevibacter sp.]|jgi:GNAT superfamily N-acetyltransferase|nr:GNAT family N-acetyltransferase [Candidatus Methanovirga aequatorialis]
MEILTGKEEHLSGILRLYKQLIPDEEPATLNKSKEIWKLIKKENIKYFVAIDDDKIVSSAFIAIIPNLTENGRPFGIVENVIVDEEYRGLGLGKTIMDKVIEYGKSQNCQYISLQSSNHRADAHKFYESVGFDRDKKIAFYMKL